MPASTSTARRLRLGVGIDTARYGHHVTFLGDDLQRVAPDLPVPESVQPESTFKVRLDDDGLLNGISDKASLVRVEWSQAREPFYVGKYEVTNREFHEFVAKGGYENERYWK